MSGTSEPGARGRRSRSRRIQAPRSRTQRIWGQWTTDEAAPGIRVWRDRLASSIGSGTTGGFLSKSAGPSGSRGNAKIHMGADVAGFVTSTTGNGNDSREETPRGARRRFDGCGTTNWLASLWSTAIHKEFAAGAVAFTATGESPLHHDDKNERVWPTRIATTESLERNSPFRIEKSRQIPRGPASRGPLAFLLLRFDPTKPIWNNPHNKLNETLNLEAIVASKRRLIPKINMQLPTMHVD